MSTTVDNRVVQMRFDNEEFEKKATKSLSTLDKLKNALKFSGASKNLDDVNKSFKEIDANPLVKAIDSVNSGFTTMIAKATVINRATNALIDTTKKFVNSMTLDQVNAGWDKYAEKTSAVQTIMAATSKDFKDTSVQMGYVNKQLEKLNWFTDETSYNFTDMVGNIGKFTSNGIKLDKSVTAMQGIATWAARSGANANEASRAMYNLSQALSVGAVKLIDWKSIENANMATAEFKENALEAAVALGTLKKKGDGTYVTMKNNAVSVQNFNNALSDAWFTSDVLLNVLDRYGGFTNKLYEVSNATDLTATQLLTAIDKYADGTLDLQAYANATGNDVETLRGYLDELSSSTYELGRKSFKSAQEAKTFAEAISATTDAVSTGWMKTFEIIFGDYEEAKKLWTSLANILYDIFATSGDIRNEMFGDWRAAGGRKLLLEGVNEAMEAILRIITPFKDAFRDIFPAKTGEDLVKLTSGFKALMQAMQLNSKQMTNLRRIARGVFSAFDIVFTIFKTVGNTIKNLVAPEMNSFADLILEVLATIGDLIYAFRNFVKEGTRVSLSFDKLGSYAKTLISILKNLFAQFKNSSIGSSGFRILENILEASVKAGSKLLNYIKEVVERIKSLDKISFSNLVGIFTGISNESNKWFTGVDKGFNGSIGLITKFKETIHDMAEQTGASFDNLKRRVSMVFEALKAYLSDVPWGALIAVAFGLMIMNTINNFIRTMNTLVSTIGTLTKGFAGLTEGINKVMTSVANMFNAVTNSINAPNYLKIAKAIAILAASLGVLALLPTDRLVAASIALAGIMVAFGILTKVLGSMPTLVATGAAAATTLAKIVLGLAASMLLLAEAFKMLENLNPDTLLDNVIAIGTLVGTLTTAVILMSSKFGLLSTAMGKTSILNSSAANIIAMAYAINTIAKTIKSISDISFRDVKSVVEALIMAVSSVITLSAALGRLNGTSALKGAIGITLTINAMGSVIKLIKNLENFRIDDIGDIVKKLALLVGALAAVFAATNLAGTQAAKAGALMAGIGLGIYALLAAIALLGNLKIETLQKGIGAIAVLSLFMGALIAFTKFAGPNAHKVSLTLLAAAAAMTVLATLGTIMGYLDDKAMKRALLYIGSLSAIFIALIYATKNATDASKSITAMTIAAVALGTMVAALTFALKESPDMMKQVMEGLSLMMVAFGLMASMSSNASMSLSSTAVALLALSGIAAIVGVLTTLAPNLGEAITAAEAITVLSVALSIVMKSIPLATATGTAAFAALPGIATGLLAILGIAAVLGLILAAINALPVPDDMPDKCLRIGESLGNLIGGFVGGTVGGSIKIIGESIKAFNDSMQGVDFEAVKSGMACVIEFAKGMAALAVVGFVNWILPGDIDFEKFKMNLGLLGEAVALYSQAISSADIPAVEASVPAVQALADIANSLPKSGGLFNMFTGAKNLASFGLQLIVFGGALTGYSLVVRACDNAAIENSVASARALVEVANTIPDWSIFGFFFGTKDLSIFGSQLVLFGDAMASYGYTVSGIDFTAIQNSVAGAKALVEIANSLPEDNILKRLVGTQDLDNFGEKIKKLGEHMAAYYTSIADAPISGNYTSRLIADIKQLAALCTDLSTLDTGYLVSFSNEIADFGYNLWQFFSYTSQVQDPTPLDTLVSNVFIAVQTLQRYTEDFRKAGQDCVAGFLEGISGNDSLEKVSESGTTIGSTFLASFRKITGWHSPWSTMLEAAKDAALGLFMGADDPKAGEAGEKLGRNTVVGYQSATSGEWSKQVSDATEELKDAATKNSDKAEEAGGVLGNGFIHGLVTKAQSGISNVSNTVKGFFDEYKDSLGNDGLLGLKGWGLDTSETGSSSLVDELTDTLSSSFTQASNNASGSYSKSGTKAADAFLTAFETRLSDLDLDLNTLDLEQQLWEATIGKSATDAEKTAKETEILTEKIRIQNEKVDQANQKYEYTVQKLGKTSEDAKKAYQSLLQEQISLANLMDQVNSTRETVSDNSTDAMVAYAQYIAESQDDLLKLGFTMEQISAAAAERTGYNLQNTTQTMTDTVTSAVSTAMNTVSDTYLATAESTLGALNPSFQAYGAEYATSIGNGMTTTTSAVTAGANALAMAGKTAIANDPQNWYTLGQNCAEGFKQGILSKVKEIADAAAAVANAAFVAAQVAIESHSPSRKFMWLGEMADQGLIVGLKSMQGEVENASTGVSEGVIKAAQDTIGQIADFIDTDATLHPQITPVVDMSDVQAGFSRINRLHAPTLHTTVTGARVAAVASSLNQRQSNLNQPVPQNNQNGPQNFNFVQNNYSPKALSRTEIYRNTNNQFTAFKEAISKV